MVYKLDAPCIGAAAHEASLDCFLVALSANGTVVLYQTWTGELRGVIGCTGHPGDRTLAHVHVDPSGLYVALAASQDARRGKEHRLKNLAKLLVGKGKEKNNKIGKNSDIATLASFSSSDSQSTQHLAKCHRTNLMRPDAGSSCL